jgi:myosin heavy subunit
LKESEKSINDLQEEIITKDLLIYDLEEKMGLLESNTHNIENVTKLKELELENGSLYNEIKWKTEELNDLKVKSEQELKKYKEQKDKLKQLEIQYAMLKEKNNSTRSENDVLIRKIQELQKEIATCEVGSYDNEHDSVKVTVIDFEENDSSDELFYNTNTNPKSCSRHVRKAKSLQEGKEETCCIHAELLVNEEKRFEETAEKIFRLEQRITCLQNANNVNSCATCQPLRNHVIKIEKELQILISERKVQLDELFDLKQEALSSSISEKDAHLSWLEATQKGNFHTKDTIERLKRERRTLLNRMKEENDNRMKLMAGLDTSLIFTVPTKITALGAFATFMANDDPMASAGASTSSFQSASTNYSCGVQGYPPSFPVTVNKDIQRLLSLQVTEKDDEQEEDLENDDAQTSKSW